jgi:oligoribonuclease (3'-5' exoribonuclease)
MKLAWLSVVPVAFDGAEQIVEIAVVITSNDLTELATTHWVVVSPRGWESKLTPEETKRLKRSGLYRAMYSAVSMRAAEESILEVIRTYADKNDITLAGCNLEATWKALDRDMPNLARWLSGARFSIETIRHVFRLADRSDVVEESVPRDRALTDVFDLVDEMRGYVTAVGCIP